jgi:lysyl-tRNA synthetase, class II
MKPVPVQSTLLTTVAYDADRKLLQLGFRDQAAYRYFDVPADLHDNLLRASSKGSYFNRFIRGRFAYARVSADSLS